MMHHLTIESRPLQHERKASQKMELWTALYCIFVVGLWPANVTGLWLTVLDARRPVYIHANHWMIYRSHSISDEITQV
jgi:hypothetical protein